MPTGIIILAAMIVAYTIWICYKISHEDRKEKPPSIRLSYDATDPDAPRKAYADWLKEHQGIRINNLKAQEEQTKPHIPDIDRLRSEAKRPLNLSKPTAEENNTAASNESRETFDTQKGAIFFLLTVGTGFALEITGLALAFTINGYFFLIAALGIIWLFMLQIHAIGIEEIEKANKARCDFASYLEVVAKSTIGEKE